MKLMRKTIWLTAVLAVLAIPQFAGAQQSSQSAQTSQSSDKQAASQSTTKDSTPQPQSVAEAARKARAAEKNAPKASMVFTNDNIPTSSTGVSVVGEAHAAAGASEGAASSEAKPGADKNDEATWRQKFSDARHKVEQDKADLEVMQRELGELNLQYYPNPTQGMNQSVSRTDITDKQNAIDAKQKQLAADQQALSDLQDALRKAGGDPAWGRE
jgi:chromosome segregation ATPase